MARLYTAGAEIELGTGSPSVELGSGGSVAPTRDTSVFRSGVASFKCSANSVTCFLITTLVQGSAVTPLCAASQTTLARAYMRFDTPPASAVRVFSVATGGGASQAVSAKLTAAGKLQLWNLVANTQIGSDSAATIATDGSAWYRIEMSVTLDASNNVTASELRLDGVTVASNSGVSIAGGGVQFIAGWIDSPGASKVCYIDDVAVNDASGAAQNTWPGPGNVVLLKPTADSAVGTSWTDSAAATSGLFASVDNTPPLGIADTTASAGHQIRNAGSNSASYDATMTTYAAAGISAADTVNAVVPLCNTAAPVVTGAKTGSVGVVSNPTIANIAFVNGATAAANFWAGGAAGTYPSNWKWEKGTITAAPTVTVGTAPVMRVTITGGTASRVAMVDAMFMYVDYTPAATVPPGVFPLPHPALIYLRKNT